MPSPVFTLSVHATYACRHSGACCTAGWVIPVEPALRSLLGADHLIPDASGACEYYDRPTRRCRIHRDHGPESLPASCHHFPRRTLIDDRGTFVTLSHFCPTAAALLFEQRDAPLTIVADPVAFPSARGYDGLEARGEWPPLVRADLLFDPDSYSHWERFIVQALGSASGSTREALVRIAAAAERLRSWTPQDVPFAAWVRTALDASVSAAGARPPAYERTSDVGCYARVCGMVPDGLDAPVIEASTQTALDQWVTPYWDNAADVVCRYLAAKAFGSWSAYQARGVRTLVAELVVSEQILRVEAARACAQAARPLDDTLLLQAIRAADWLLVHLVDRQAFTDWLGEVETAGS